MIVIMYQVYRIRDDANGNLSLLCLHHKTKVKYYDKYFINEYVFHTKEYCQCRKTYNSGVFVKGSTSKEFEVNYYKKLEKVIEF